MIPESGTPSELKRAWLEAVAVPMLGEVYAWIDGSTFRECWKVTDLSETDLHKAKIDVYDANDNGCFERRVCGSSVHLHDWKTCIHTGAVRYVGMEVPTTPHDP